MPGVPDSGEIPTDAKPSLLYMRLGHRGSPAGRLDRALRNGQSRVRFDSRETGPGNRSNGRNGGP